MRDSSPAARARRWVGAARDRALRPVLDAQDRQALALGRMEARAVRSASLQDLHDAEFRVFSQWGEDGIIQFLISRVPIERRIFVEFGVEDYREANTRFLLENDYWRGLILDGGTDHLDFVRRGDLLWRHTIEAVSVFLTRDNVNEAIRSGGVEGDVGLLSVDVDGNDYWLLEAIEVISPRILVVEYNSLFGSSAAISVPYRADFDRHRAHWSGLYYGASLSALVHLASGRGYQLVGCNRAGTNAFFVRADVAGDLPAVSTAAAYVKSQHRESRDSGGRLSYVSRREEQLGLIGDLPVVDVRTGGHGKICQFCPPQPAD